MAARDRGRVVLFLDGGDRGRIACALFAATAARIGLPWRAESACLPGETPRPLGAAAAKVLKARGVAAADIEREVRAAAEEDFAAAELVVAFDESTVRPLFEQHFPAHARQVAYWDIGAAGDSIAAIEREVSGLVARLLGGRKGDDVPEDAAEPAKSADTKKPATVRVGRETKGRKGKGVTTVSDLPLDAAGLAELATRLKGLCGSGGTAKDGRIEIQGDHRDKLTVELERLGYRVKRVGG